MPPDVTDKTMVMMSDVNEDLLRKDLSSSATQEDSTACQTGSLNNMPQLYANKCNDVQSIETIVCHLELCEF